MGILQRVVKNDAMRSDPPEIYGWRVFALACSACFGAMIFGWDIGAIGGILTLPAFVEYASPSESGGRTYLTSDSDYNITKDNAADLGSNIVSTLQAGCLVGSLAAYWFADKYGRKPTLMGSAVWTTVGVIFQSAGSGKLALMYIGRFVSGIGVGAASMLVPVYISEQAPRAIRGGLTGLYQLFIATGVMLSFWVNYGASLHLHGKDTYVIPLALQMLPAVALFAGMFFCNESPRWLARQDNWEEAKRILSLTRNLPLEHEYIQMELTEMSEQLENERRLIGGATFMDLQREMWTIPGNRNRALLSIALMVCQQMTGTNAINYYAPQIFSGLGITGVTNGLFATGIYGIVKMVTCAAFLLFAADSLGRRRSLLWTSIAQGLAMFIIGIYVRVYPPEPSPDGKISIPPFGYVALVCIFLFAGFFQWGWGPVCWIYVSEIPTARLRGLNVALAAATQWIFNFVVAKSVPIMLKNVGYKGYGTYFIFGSFSFAMMIFVWFFIPETKGLSLEKMDDLFGVTELATKGDIEESHTPPTQELSEEKATGVHVEKQTHA
ncbi:hypothetical protein V495_07440 [Pseudogymnoascus sp. VKM F-4514 (FW-929)]|nr:hypothetical protein V490_04565 [Pseudogymnoascus sp. VKM F-3557]KFY37024.1 hypothetical protein V495_07440 [Pseudogymnoascus sp. VKM F-4514 (FW-929)]KFY58371.1 hypothetical protein V497_04867 [Pseudogymnoascus sp. VKM F-4516 (FW-969)]